MTKDIEDQQIDYQFLVNKLQKRVNDRRQELLQDRDALLDVLYEGSRKAQERAAETMDKVRSAVSINYGDLR